MPVSKKSALEKLEKLTPGKSAPEKLVPEKPDSEEPVPEGPASERASRGGGIGIEEKNLPHGHSFGDEGSGWYGCGGRSRRPRTVLLTLMGLDIGGAETHAVTLARHLKEAGCRVIVASNGGHYEAEIAALGIPHYRLPLHRMTAGGFVRAVLGLRRIIRCEKVDLIHAHARIPALASDLARWGTGVPLVVTAHARFKTSFLLVRFSRWGDITIAVSPDIKEHLVRFFGVPQEKICLIPNGIDVELFKPRQICSLLQPPRAGNGSGGAAETPKVLDVPEAPEAPQTAAGEIRMLYLSRLDEWLTSVALKVVQAVEELHREFPRLRLWVAGEGVGRQAVEARAQEANALAGMELVRFMGALPRVWEVMAECDLVVGVSRAALEAMACGCNVILAGGEGFGGLLREEDLPQREQDNFTARLCGRDVEVEDLKASLREFFSLSHEERRRRGQFFRSYVVEKYSSREMATATLEVYQAVWRSRGSMAPP